MKRFNVFKRIGILFSLLFLVSCNTNNNSNNNNNNNDDTVKTINFYSLNDFHGAIEYQTGKQAGISRIGNYLMTEKANNPNTTFILSSGDMWQGSVDSNLNHGALMTEMMNKIGFDSMAIGNHEFDWGEEYIRTNQKNMNFPLLGCNIFYKGTQNSPDYLKPYTTITKGDVKIGIIGSVQVGIGSSILRSISNKFDYLLPNDYIKKYSDILFTVEKCDAVILSTHDGNYGGYKDLTTVSTVSKRNYVDGIFLGHDHQVYNDSLNGVPYSEGGSSGKMIANITLKIKNHNVIESSNEVIDCINNCTQENNELNAIYDVYKPGIEVIKNKVVGNAPSYISKSDVGLIAAKSIYHYINKHTEEFDYKVNFTCTNAGGVRTYINAGEVTYGEIYQCLPFDNNIVMAYVDSYGLGLYKSQYESTSYDDGGSGLGSDGKYHVGTINYVYEKMDGDGVNLSSVYSPSILRDIVVEAINDNIISAITPIVS